MVFDPNAAAAPGSGLFGLPHTPETAKVVIVPVPWEATTSYGGGTASGPQAVLAASRQVDLFDVETGKPYEAGIALLPEPVEVVHWNLSARELARPIIDAGGAGDDHKLQRQLAEVNALGVALNDHVYRTTQRWLSVGKLVGVLGGDHAVPFGAIKAIAERYPGVGILHVDAHADLRHAYEGFLWSHASIMDNVVRELGGVARLVQVGIRDLCEEEHDAIVGSRGRIVTHFDVAVARRLQEGERFAEIAARIVEDLPHQVYVSFDIDGLDPTLCPNTGTPVPGGLSFAQADLLLRAVVRSGRTIVGFDLNEVAPGPHDEWDANVGARMLYKLIGWALLSQGVGTAGPLG